MSPDPTTTSASSQRDGQAVPLLRQHARRAGRAAVAELVHVAAGGAPGRSPPRSHTAFSIIRFAWCPMNSISRAVAARRAGPSSSRVATDFRMANPCTADPSCAKCPPAGITTLFQPAGSDCTTAVPHAHRRGHPRRDHRGRAAVAPEHRRAPVVVVHRAGVVLDVDHEHVVGQRLGTHGAQVVQLHREAGARRVQVVGRGVDAELRGHQAGFGRDRVLRRAPAGDDQADVGRREARARQREPRRERARLRVGVERDRRRRRRAGVPRARDVVERQHRPPAPDAHALHDPRVVGADVQRRQEGVVDPVLGVEVADAVDEEVARGVLLSMQRVLPRPPG